MSNKSQGKSETASAAGPQTNTQPMPTVGRSVHYRLSEPQAAYADALAGRKNVLKAGKVCPATVTDVHSADCVDLRIIIGAHDAFQTSVMRGDGNGMWDWPPRA